MFFGYQRCTHRTFFGKAVFKNGSAKDRLAVCFFVSARKLCDKTDGSALGHNYKDGKCTRCNKTDPNDNSQVMVWIPTNGGTKYHSKSNCSNMKDPQKMTKQEAIDMGYEPCKKCH